MLIPLTDYVGVPRNSSILEGTIAVVPLHLSAVPPDTITVPLLASHPLENPVWPASLLFNSSNWNISQEAYLLCRDNFVADGNRYVGATLGPSAGSSHAMFNSIGQFYCAVYYDDRGGICLPTARLRRDN